MSGAEPLLPSSNNTNNNHSTERYNRYSQQGSPEQKPPHQAVPDQPQYPATQVSDSPLYPNIHVQHPHGNYEDPYPSPQSSTQSFDGYRATHLPESSRSGSEAFYYYPSQQSSTWRGSTGPTSFPVTTSTSAEMMAAQAPLRHSLPTLYGGPSYNISPVSTHSSRDSQTRGFYNQSQEHFYYGGPSAYAGSTQPGYGYYSTPLQPRHLASQHPLQTYSYQQPQQSSIGYQLSSSSTQAHTTAPFDTSRYQTHLQRPSSQLGPSPIITSSYPVNTTATHSASTTTPSSAQNAAPGPIPATTPVVSKKGPSGVPYITFEYSKDRVKNAYEIRCDIDQVDTKTLTSDFKNNNCVYPRAYSQKPYQGNRLEYETSCNEVGWKLAWLNPELQAKRGLIQRAVDSWRNSSSDHKMRSRRVRRLNKTARRQQMQAQSAASFAAPDPLTSPESYRTMPPPFHEPPSMHAHQRQTSYGTHMRPSTGSSSGLDSTGNL